MTYTDIKKEAKKYRITIRAEQFRWVIFLYGREMKSVPKLAGLAKLADACAEVAG